MKTILFSLIIILSGIFSGFSQEAQFPLTVISAGGGTNSFSTTHISKWRLKKINVFQIQTEDLKNALIASDIGNNQILINNIGIEVFPNPVNKELNLKFEIESKTNFDITIYDLSGRKHLNFHSKEFTSGQVFSVNMEGFSPSIYIVNIRSEDLKLNKNFKINKL